MADIFNVPIEPSLSQRCSIHMGLWAPWKYLC